mmetsp:Transcript_31505/g.84049  ORF Transcript_31505/g.84049 Transcript_31505/m.84049 type:complete len:241 (-) Transcript_31505:1457-2179(-)
MRRNLSEKSPIQVWAECHVATNVSHSRSVAITTKVRTASKTCGTAARLRRGRGRSWCCHGCRLLEGLILPGLSDSRRRSRRKILRHGPSRLRAWNSVWNIRCVQNLAGRVRHLGGDCRWAGRPAWRHRQWRWRGCQRRITHLPTPRECLQRWLRQPWRSSLPFGALLNFQRFLLLFGFHCLCTARDSEGHLGRSFPGDNRRIHLVDNDVTERKVLGAIFVILFRKVERLVHEERETTGMV